jgi:ATP-binding cassette, subfamily C, bacterial exporter for protease/lipase
VFYLLREKNELSAALELSRSGFKSVAAFSLVINVLGLVPAIYMMQVYDRVMASRSESTLLVLTLLVIGLLGLAALLDAARTFVLVRVGTQFDSQLNQRIFTASFSEKLRSSNTNASQSLRDLTNVRQFLTGQAMLAFFDLPWVAIYLALMFLFHPLLGLLAIAGALVSCWLSYMNSRASDGLLSESSALAVSSGMTADENLRNAEVVEAMGMLGNLTKRWRIDHLKFLLLQSRASDKAGLWISASRYFRIFLQSAALGLGAFLALEQAISPGMMIASSILMGRALAPIDQLIGTSKQYSSAKIAYKRLLELLANSPLKQQGLPLPTPVANISFEKVTMGPPSTKRPTLHNITFSMNAGRIIGIVGPSGAGKSTLARALVGVWAPWEGVVRLDGADIHSWDKERLGDHLGYLPQDVELFAGTIAENIARFGDIVPAKVIKAAQDAGVHDMILRLPNGYDTVVGAQGLGLSGGQRQRIALARALYGDPALLVLDEPNASLDDVGVAALMNAVQGVKQRKSTVILITHRMDIIQQTDGLMLLKEGQIALIGPTQEVLKQLHQRGESQQAPANQISRNLEGNDHGL